MKGRKPKDLSIRLLSGNPGKRPLRNEGSSRTSDEPFVLSELDKPDWLNKDESEEWDRLVSRLRPIFSSADAGMVTVAVNAYSQMRAASKVLKKGLTYTTKNKHGQKMIRQRPEVGILQQARMAYHRALAELGASPVARTRVKKLPESTQQELPGMHRLLG